MGTKTTAPASISLTISASSPEAMAEAVAALAAQFGGYDKLAERVNVTAGSTQPLTGETKIEADLPLPDVPDTLGQPVASAPAEAAIVPTPNVVGDTEDMGKLRQEAIDKLTAWFGRNPNEIGSLNKLQAKFGVKMFKDIPDDQVPAFAQEAHMLASGNAQV